MKPFRLLQQANPNLLLFMLLLISMPFSVSAQTAFPITPLPANNIAPNNITPSDYVLGSGDQITVSVFGYEEYTGARTVLPDGTITLPLLGAIPVAGQTTDSLARNLTARLNLLLVDPVVTVSLSIQRPVVVNVAGEVQREVGQGPRQEP